MLILLLIEGYVQIQSLLLRQFRNIHSQDIFFHQPVIVFTGGNGQGKTNILESIYYAGTLKSFRKHPSKYFIEKGYSETRIGIFFLHDGIEKELGIHFQNDTKTISLNKKILSNLHDFVGLIPMVAFMPDDLMIMKGDPSGRRDFIDRGLFTSFPNYLFEFRQYQKLLKQRNAVLKDTVAHNKKEMLDTFTEQLAIAGGIIIQRRLDFLNIFLPELQQHYESFGRKNETLSLSPTDHILRKVRIEYISKGISYLPNREAKEYSQTLMEKLEQLRLYDEKVKYTSVGPHCDDFRFLLNENDAKNFASQGQIRLLILMLKLALVSLVKKHIHISPILLLDDVASELDPLVQKYLFEALSFLQSQVFLSTASIHTIPLLQSQKYQVYLVANGQVLTP